MTISNKCLIDNWSIEQAACLLESDSKQTFPTDESFVHALGGLSNFINGLLLYEDSKYISNGREYSWERFDWFKQNTSAYFTPYTPDKTYSIQKNSNIGDADNYTFGDKYIRDGSRGIEDYLIISNLLNADLFVSPVRAEHLKRYTSQYNSKTGDTFLYISQIIDEKIVAEKKEIWSNYVKMGIQENMLLPTLTQYVFSQASNIEDLFKIIMQLKSTSKISDLQKNINIISQSTKNYGQFQIEIENIIAECFGKPVSKEKPWEINISVLFLTLTKSFSLQEFNRKEYLTILKDLITCRTEAYKLRQDIERIFNRKLELRN
jgi:hypothetical protein